MSALVFLVIFVLLQQAALAASPCADRHWPDGSCASSSQSLLQSKVQGALEQGSLTQLVSDDNVKQWQARAESLVRDGKKLSKIEVATIRAINETFENSTIPALKKGHLDDQAQVNANLQSFTNCNQNLAQDSAAAVRAKEAVDTMETEHRFCRGNQTKLQSKYDNISREVDTFVKELSSSSSSKTCNFRGVATAVDSFISEGLQWLTEKQTVYAGIKIEYNATKGALKSKSAACDSAQSSLETSYCLWLGKATAASLSFVRCWEEANATWTVTMTNVLDSAVQRENEYAATRKIQCFLGVLSSKAGSAARAKLISCSALAPNISMFRLSNTTPINKSSLGKLGNLTARSVTYDGLNNAGKAKPCATLTHLCSTDERVRAHRCEACEPGKANKARDDAVDEDTTCSVIECLANEHVKSHTCIPCAAGMVNDAGDNASGANSSCASIICGANYRVVNNSCHACPAGTRNRAGDDASGADTACDTIRCQQDQYVNSHACHTCLPGTTNAAGDDASGGNTTCSATTCLKNQKVVSSRCRGCPAGKSNAAGDDASRTDTKCDAIKCSANQRVRGNACVACPDGKTRRAGDDASGPDTSCSPVLCKANQHVVSNACVSCPSGRANVAGDDASKADTDCDKSPWIGQGRQACEKFFGITCTDSLCGSCRGRGWVKQGAHSCGDSTVFPNQGTNSDGRMGCGWPKLFLWDGRQNANLQCRKYFGTACTDSLCGSCRGRGWVKQGAHTCGGSLVFPKQGMNSDGALRCGWPKEQVKK